MLNKDILDFLYGLHCYLCGPFVYKYNDFSNLVSTLKVGKSMQFGNYKSYDSKDSTEYMLSDIYLIVYDDSPELYTFTILLNYDDVEFTLTLDVTGKIFYKYPKVLIHEEGYYLPIDLKDNVFDLIDMYIISGHLNLYSYYQDCYTNAYYLADGVGYTPYEIADGIEIKDVIGKNDDDQDDLLKGYYIATLHTNMSIIPYEIITPELCSSIFKFIKGTFLTDYIYESRYYSADGFYCNSSIELFKISKYIDENNMEIQILNNEINDMNTIIVINGDVTITNDKIPYNYIL